MKISFPKYQRRTSIRFDQSGKCLYVVVCQFSSGQWGIADFWNAPFVSSNYKEALSLKQRIMARGDTYRWNRDQFAIAKVQL